MMTFGQYVGLLHLPNMADRGPVRQARPARPGLHPVTRDNSKLLQFLVEDLQ